MEQLTLEQAANYEPPIPEQYYDDGNDKAYTAGHQRGFISGGNWQKEQYKRIFQLAFSAACELDSLGAVSLCGHIKTELERLENN